MSAFFVVSYVILWVLVAALAVAVFALYHHFGQMYLVGPEHQAAQGPAEGDWLKDLETTALDGGPVILPLNRPSVVLFMSTTCNLCSGMRGDLALLAADRPEVALVVICGGKPAMVRAWAEDLPASVRVVPDPSGRIASRYNVDLLPFQAAVGRDGVVRVAGLVNNYDGLNFACDAALNSLPIVERGDSGDHAHDHAHDQGHDHDHDHDHGLAADAGTQVPEGSHSS